MESKLIKEDPFQELFSGTMSGTEAGVKATSFSKARRGPSQGHLGHLAR